MIAVLLISAIVKEKVVELGFWRDGDMQRGMACVVTRTVEERNRNPQAEKEVGSGDLSATVREVEGTPIQSCRSRKKY